MTRFNFEYESVLEHRRKMEDLAQHDLAKLLRERMVLENMLRTLDQAVREDHAALARSLVGMVDVTRAQRHATFATQTAMRHRQITGRMEALAPRIEAARHRLRDAMKQRKAIERLRDKRQRLSQTQQRRREYAERDGLVTIDRAGAICPI